MPNDTAISIRGLSKAYTIAHNQAKHTLLGEALLERLRRPFGGAERETFWALRDVSFDVKKGEVVGIIGSNGAGKSTLLKVLSRITEPTAGEVRLYGRVGSLLEVGTGFHPELTGRENIYLNGAILGMKRREIDRQFDAIVDFAEVEQFLDTPVKRYSSGMYVRMAFAVAAHLNPEILIVDEVLAVGDVAFQKKCLGKMQDVSRQEGRTVLFVSHNMAAIAGLCSRALLVQMGELATDGTCDRAISIYQSAQDRPRMDSQDLRTIHRTGSGQARFRSVRVTYQSDDGNRITAPETGCDIVFELDIECERDIEDANVAVIVYDSTGYRLIDVNTAIQGWFVSVRAGYTAGVRFVIYNLLLKPGTYYAGYWIGKRGGEDYDNIEFGSQLCFRHAGLASKEGEVFPGTYQCAFDCTRLDRSEHDLIDTDPRTPAEARW